MLRDLLRRWWGLELGLALADGSGYERTSHATCATLAKQPGGACEAALGEAASALANKKDGTAIAQRCHAGLTIVAAPVRGDGGLVGVVYASGGRAGVDA